MNQAYKHPFIGVLLPWCEREGIVDVSAINPRGLDRLSVWLLEAGGRNGQPLSPRSVHSYTRAINHFLSWARKEGAAVEAKVQLPKLPKRLVEVLGRDEAQRMEHAAKAERDKLIIRLLADTGLRVGELLALRTNDLVEQNRNYYEPLTTSGVDQMIRNVGESAGIAKRVYPHVLRHSFATWQLSRGMNPIQLAQILSHSSLTMNQAMYSHLSPVDAYEAVLRTYREEGDG